MIVLGDALLRSTVVTRCASIGHSLEPDLRARASVTGVLAWTTQSIGVGLKRSFTLR